jgi:riboflavin biosynthesis pyrimidine reductase
MNTTVLAPLETLFEEVQGEEEQGLALPLPPELATLYGHLHFPAHRDRPHVIGNFVTTLDGVVTLNAPGQSGGGPISGFNQHDHLVMGLLRAVADAVIVGAGTLRAVPHHRWTADYVYPALSPAYQHLRMSLGKPKSPVNVIVTARGEVDLRLPVFQSDDTPVVIVTTAQGKQCIAAHRLAPFVRVSQVPETTKFRAQAIIQAVCRERECRILLVEGGPQSLGTFLAEGALDELFLTLAPQIAGRDNNTERPGLVVGQLFAPEHPLWGTLVSVKRGGSHLFLRYAFSARELQ